MNATEIVVTETDLVEHELPLTARREKMRKRERKRVRDQVRRIDAWQQYRTLWDGIDFKRQILNMGDKKVRFALVIMGALNAVLLLVLSRDPMLHTMPLLLRAGLAVLLGIYGIVTFRFMAHAIEALRPAPEARKDDAAEWERRELARPGDDDSQPVGLIIRGPLQQLRFDEERLAWSQARICDINAELILFNRASSYILTHQQVQLHKVYQDLKVLVLLGATGMVVVVAAGVWHG
jgi:hypothetical protein